MTEHPRTLAVLGGGASGCLVATQLLRRAASPVRVMLIERGDRLARGVAYGTAHPSHLLNVPAGRMSAFADDASHFVRWLAREPATASLGPSDFAPRVAYGNYLQACLEEAITAARPGVELQVLTDEALRLEAGSEAVTVHFRRNPPVRALGVVLAIGNPPATDPPAAAPELLASDHWRGNPWAPQACERIPRESAVLLLGTGLTMVDVILALDDRGHRGPIVALSRRGLLPRTHVFGAVAAPWELPRADWPRTVRGWLRRLRERAKAEDARTRGRWRSAIDGLRGITPRLWSELPAAEKRRFLRHLQPYWDSHRHRMAPAAGDRLRSLQKVGRFIVLAGRVTALEGSATGVDLRFTPRGGTKPEERRGFAAVFNCTGPSFARAAVEDALLRGLVECGLARVDPLGLGLDATPRGELVGATGEVAFRLLTLGSPLKGALWESIAIPEIRIQSDAVARRLLGLLRAPSG